MEGSIFSFLPLLPTIDEVGTVCQLSILQHSPTALISNLISGSLQFSPAALRTVPLTLTSIINASANLNF